MTPQMQLTLSSMFDGKHIRATEINGEIWIPVVDLADAWEVDRTTLTKIINRNPEIFRTLSTVIELPSSREISSNPQSVNNSLRLVNERGSVVLALKVSAKDLKNPIAKEKVIEFQLWVPQLMQDLRKGVVQLTTPQQVHAQYLQSPVDILNEQLDVADVLIKRVGVGKEQAHAYAVILAGEKAGTDLQCYATAIKAQSKQTNLLTSGQDEIAVQDKVDYERMFSMQAVAEFVRKTPQQVKEKMKELNLAFEMNGMWHLTKIGEQYGKVFFITPGAPYNMTRRPYVKYNDKLVALMREQYGIAAVPVARVSEV